MFINILIYNIIKSKKKKTVWISKNASFSLVFFFLMIENLLFFLKGQTFGHHYSSKLIYMVRNVICK